MATQPIGHTAHSYTYKKPRRPQSDAEFSLGPEQSKKRQPDIPPAENKNRDQLLALLTEISGGHAERISFKDIADYRDTMKTGWDKAIRADLKALGINTTDRFRLLIDPGTGLVSAGSDHPDKSRIDAYFAANQDRADEFGKLVQIDKLVDAAQNNLSPDDMKQRLLPEAMALWYRTNADANSLRPGGGIIFGTETIPYKALDIHV